MSHHDSRKAQQLQLCPRCEELIVIHNDYRLCNPCQIEMLRICQANAIALQEEQRVA